MASTPLIFGMRMSQITVSSTNRFSPVLITSMAFSPFSASRTSYPAFSRVIRTKVLTTGSSSTTRTRPFPVDAPNHRSDLCSVTVFSFFFIYNSLHSSCYCELNCSDNRPSDRTHLAQRMPRTNKTSAIVRATERVIMDSIGLDPCKLLWKRAPTCVRQPLYQMKIVHVAEMVRTEDGNYSRNSMASRFRRSQY